MYDHKNKKNKHIKIPTIETGFSVLHVYLYSSCACVYYCATTVLRLPIKEKIGAWIRPKPRQRQKPFPGVTVRDSKTVIHDHLTSSA